MSKQANDGQKLIFILLAVFLLLFLSRFLFRFVWVFLVALVGIALYFGIRMLVKKYRDKKYLKTSEGQIHSRILFCQDQIAKNLKEKQEIQQSIAELKKQIEDRDIAPPNKEETLRLIEAFQAELKLRGTKLSFFQACEVKLKQMLSNQGLSKKLDAQKRKLKKLQENHFEDLAEMEELKSNVEMDVLYLDTIERLSQRIQDSTNSKDAEQVRVELETMTKDLKDFDRNL